MRRRAERERERRAWHLRAAPVEDTRCDRFVRRARRSVKRFVRPFLSRLLLVAPTDNPRRSAATSFSNGGGDNGSLTCPHLPFSRSRTMRAEKSGFIPVALLRFARSSVSDARVTPTACHDSLTLERSTTTSSHPSDRLLKREICEEQRLFFQVCSTPS